MSSLDLSVVLEKHQLWLSYKEGGVRADLREADLRGVNLIRANLIEANLRGADLREADLRGANLTRANLVEADLCGANLTGANLVGANLRGANLTGANLSGTCMDPAILQWQRAFVAECPADAEGYRIVYRSAVSLHCGDTIYEPGKVYEAPVLSFSAETACHPGIYVGTLKQVRAQIANAGVTVPVVRGRVRDGDWVICEKGIRTSRFECLEIIQEEG